MAQATIIMTARERHDLTLEAIESVATTMGEQGRLVYADTGSPAWLRDRLDHLPQAWNVEVVRMEASLLPQQVRARLAPTVPTEYTVFLDNDVQCPPGWLDALLRAAGETGAGIVGPLYLEGDGTHPPRVHMAGGYLREEETDAGLVLHGTHEYQGADPQDVPRDRRPVDFLEYHCMLMRTELLPQVLDDRINFGREEVDTALSARKLGFPVYLEPSAQVLYRGYHGYVLEDLPFFRSRWDLQGIEACMAVFAEKWGIADADFTHYRKWLRGHVAAVDLLRPWTADGAAAMAASDLQQNRSGLLDLALRRGYGMDELDIVAKAYGVALRLMDGVYRPCGRPMLEHLTGTASVLVRYGFRATTVAAGLLHAAYTHCPPHAGGAEASMATVCNHLGGQGTPVESLVRAYTRRESQWQAWFDGKDAGRLSLLDAEVLALAAANEIDMHLSGEIRYSGRASVLPESGMRVLTDVCALLGVPGLAATVAAVREETAPVPTELLTRLPRSFRVTPDRTRTYLVSPPALSWLED